MTIRHILFDLDGTLLPMKQDDFTGYYLPLLAKAYTDRGIAIDKKEFIGAVWKSYKAMVKNDGSRTNREAFWEHFKEALPIAREEAEEIALEFYDGDFNRTVCIASPTPLADQAVKTAKQKGIEVYLATNPVFPRIATLNRIKWAGLDAEDFKVITTYEDNRFCKPNPEYFRSILETYELDPQECVMVGNDVAEDLSIRTLGVRTFLLTDTMENRDNLAIHSEYAGSMEELLAWIKAL